MGGCLINIYLSSYFADMPLPDGLHPHFQTALCCFSHLSDNPFSSSNGLTILVMFPNENIFQKIFLGETMIRTYPFKILLYNQNVMKLN